MLEIQLDDQIETPSIAVCMGGNIRLVMSPKTDLQDALDQCEEQIVYLLRERFLSLLGDRNFPRVFKEARKGIIISPDPDEIPRSEIYFDFIFGV